MLSNVKTINAVVWIPQDLVDVRLYQANKVVWDLINDLVSEQKKN